MNKLFYLMLLSFFITAPGISWQNIAVAQESKGGHSHEKAEKHGGTVVMTKNYHFEVVFKPEAIRVYVYDGTQKPLQIKEDVNGKVVLKFKNGNTDTLDLRKNKIMQMDTKQAETHHHEMRATGYLQADVDLSKAEPGNLKAVFELKGLPNEKESEVSFTETFNGFAKDLTPATQHKHEH